MLISSVPCLGAALAAPAAAALTKAYGTLRRRRRRAASLSALALDRAAREGAARGCDTRPRDVIKTLHYELRRLILRSFIC